jgi:type IV pilus assembly protein PilA
MKMNKKGFTLIELLIVVAIIAILAAIAIPQFSAYRIRGYNAAADSDLRNIKIALEAFFTDNQVYASTAGVPTVVAPAVSVQSGTGIPGVGGLVFGPATYTVQVTAQTITASQPSANANLIFGLSNNVGAVIATTTSDYTVATANTSGDTIYAGESGVTTLFKSGKNAAGTSCAVAAAAQAAGGAMTYKPAVPSAPVNPPVDLGANFVAI